MYYFSNVATHVALCFITRILLEKKAVPLPVQQMSQPDQWPTVFTMYLK